MRRNLRRTDRGPFALAALLLDFFVRVNAPLRLNACGTPSSADIFDLCGAWANLSGDEEMNDVRCSWGKETPASSFVTTSS